MTQVLAALMCLVQGFIFENFPNLSKRSVVIQSLSSFEPTTIKSHRIKRDSELLELESKSNWGANSTDCEENFSTNHAKLRCKRRVKFKSGLHASLTFEPKSKSRFRVRGSEEKFSSAFYPLSVFLSSIFVLFTIFIYVIIRDLRKNIFEKLTLGFLINVFIAHFTAGIVHSLNYFDQKQTYVGTWGCIVLGYIIQHTFVAILFWTNAMVFTLIKTFSNVLLHSVKTDTVDRKERQKIFLSITYAQGRQFTYLKKINFKISILTLLGMPLILTFVTILMDQFGSKESSIRPNMGKYRCMLGSTYVPNTSFLKTSLFLYFYLIILIITSVNIICFIIIAFKLISQRFTTKSIFSR